VVLTFLDTKCREACPIIAGQIALTWTLLTLAEREAAVAIAISTDPRDDTRSSIRAFLARHRATGTIRYLVGSVPDMTRLWRRFQILSSLESGDADTHSAPVRIYGRDLTWLATQHPGVDLSPRNLVHDIRLALG
jgi:cytochrome oxidase Cu insertion factor (SCO1/SenC/PrrC family)